MSKCKHPDEAAEIATLREDERATRKQWCGRDFDHLPLPDAVGASMKVAAMCHEAEVWALREKIARATAAPPREPTREMALAGVNAVSVTGSDYGNTFRRQKTPLVNQAKRDDVVQTWRAMYDAAPVAAAPTSSTDYFQRRGRHADIVDEALATFETWQNYDAHACLLAIVSRMRERMEMDAAPVATPAECVHAADVSREVHDPEGEAARPRTTDAPMTDTLQLLDDLAEWDMFTGSGKVADAEYWLRRINAVRAGRASVAQSTA